METKKTIYLIRHGETEYNRLGKVQGSGVDSDLNEVGIKQADLFFKQYGDYAFDKVYTSMLKRTWQSVGGFIQKGIPHQPMAEWNEISWGSFEGELPPEHWKAEYMKMVAEWESGNLTYRVPRGENPLELQERQKRGWQQLINAPNEKNILLCMHGRALKSLLCLLTNTSLSRMEGFGHSNLCLYVLEYDLSNGITEIVRANCTEHLREG